MKYSEEKDRTWHGVASWDHKTKKGIAEFIHDICLIHGLPANLKLAVTKQSPCMGAKSKFEHYEVLNVTSKQFGKLLLKEIKKDTPAHVYFNQYRDQMAIHLTNPDKTDYQNFLKPRKLYYFHLDAQTKPKVAKKKTKKTISKKKKRSK